MGFNLDEVLKQMEYPGRFIVIGRDSQRRDVVVYGVTGRSPSSQARRIVDEGSRVRVEPTDPNILKQGNPSLLLYDCIRFVNGNIIVSNGRQTDLIAETIEKSLGQPTALSALVKAFERPYLVEGERKGKYIDLTKFEPDEPSNTPRISAVVTREGAAISIVRSIGLGCRSGKSFFEIPPAEGWCTMIATYAGQNVPSGKPIPMFTGEPREVRLPDSEPKFLAEHIYRLLQPKEPGEGILEPGKDFRVGVVAMFYDRRTDTVNTHVVNRHGA